MADPKPDIAEEHRILQRAIRRKWNKFIWSGLLCIIIGLVFIIGALPLYVSPYSVVALLILLGIIIVIVGLIRIFIGIINPFSPDDLHRTRSPEKGLY